MTTLVKSKVEYVPLINDIMFKVIFGLENNIRFTTYLVEALLGVPEGTYEGKIELVNTYNCDKLSIKSGNFETDIIIKLPNQEKLVLEAYLNFSKLAKLKSIIYAFFALIIDLPTIAKLDEVKRVREYNFVSNCSNNNYRILSKLNNRELVPKLFDIYVYNIANIEKISYSIDERLRDILRLLNAKTEAEALKVVKGKEILESMLQEMLKFLNSEGAKVLFDSTKFHEALVREETIQKQNQEIAKKLLKLKTPINTIIAATGLTKKEISQLNRG